MTLRDRLTKRWMRRIVRSPEGRAFLLGQLADAESNGENRVFEEVLARVDDPQLAKMVRKHQDDEVRHARLFEEAADRQGARREPVPAQLKLIDRLDAAVGGFLERPVTSARDVMEAYALLQVIEERAVTQFALLEAVFREAGDAATADVIADIAADEDRHLRYCVAISKRYAPDEATRLETLARYREAEARCFRENGQAMVEHLFARPWFAGRPLERALWRFIMGLGARGELPYTRFAAATPVAEAA